MEEQESGKKKSKLNFDNMENDGSTENVGRNYSKKVQQAENKYHHVEKKLEKAKRKQPKKNAVRLERVFDDETQKGKTVLTREKMPITQKKQTLGSKAAHKATAETSRFIHRKISEVENDNVAVEAVHKGEQLLEEGARFYNSRKSSKADKSARQIEKMESKAAGRYANWQYQKFAEDNPLKRKSNPVSKRLQKKRYQKQYRTKHSGTPKRKTATKVAKKLQEVASKNAAMIACISIIFLLLIMIMCALSSCGAMFTSSTTDTYAGSWLSDPDEIDAVDVAFSQMEMNLQNTIDNIENNYRGYDEYNYNIGEIGHNPYILSNYLAAKYSTYTADGVAGEVSSVFNAMYSLNIRGRRETRYRPVLDYDEEGEPYIRYVPYTVKILDTTLSVRDLNSVVLSRMNDDQKELYDLYQDTKGAVQKFGTPLNLYWYNYVSSHYGYTKNASNGRREFHRGIDIAVPEGTQVLATQNGTVVEVSNAPGYGNYVVIANSDGYVSKYGHLSQINVSVGRKVTQGQVIAKSGSTGSATGSQLYIELLFNGAYYNPLYYMQVGSGTLYGENQNGEAVPPQGYDDETVQRLFNVAKRYIGRPYTFGGTPPVSFDCSSYVCWVFTNSGVYNMPRTTAQGIYNQCIPISASEAKAGDLIFFQGTYDTGDDRDVTHVGIYCGNGVMLHCGDPIKYSSINTTYWQSHFYSFGRVPYNE